LCVKVTIGRYRVGRKLGALMAREAGRKRAAGAFCSAGGETLLGASFD
jgi:hypothetical protein